MKRWFLVLMFLLIATSAFAADKCMVIPCDTSGNLLPTFVASSAEYDNGNCATTMTITLANGNNQKITLTGNCTLTVTFPSDLSVSSVFIRLYQDGTGSHTMDWNGFMKWASATPPTLTTTANYHDDISCKCFHAESKCECGESLDMR